MEEEPEVQSESFQDFILKALSAKRKTAYDLLVGQHLTVSTAMADPLQKLRIICEAAFLTSEKANIDMNLINKIYSISLSFLNVGKGLTVPWGFSSTSRNYEEYVKPWHNEDVTLTFIYTSRAEMEEKMARLAACKTAYEQFFLLTTNLGLTTLSLQMLKVEFLAWAMPIIMQAAAEIARLLDPEMLKSLLMGKPPAEKAEETAV